jgi:hypothetical protein
LTPEGAVDAVASAERRVARQLSFSSRELKPLYGLRTNARASARRGGSASGSGGWHRHEKPGAVSRSASRVYPGWRGHEKADPGQARDRRAFREFQFHE